jgi:hypothetical protein
MVQFKFKRPEGRDLIESMVQLKAKGRLLKNSFLLREPVFLFHSDLQLVE